MFLFKRPPTPTIPPGKSSTTSNLQTLIRRTFTLFVFQRRCVVSKLYRICSSSSTRYIRLWHEELQVLMVWSFSMSGSFNLLKV
ncbi:hypothetical protein L1887_34024 [Cichorium endivia]|nr:hypothetical protein L1887_34024 [Cichorium endivia]